MSTQQLKAAVGAGQAAAREPKSFPGMIDQLKKQVALALPKHLNADRMARIALTAFNSNEKLRKCDPVSIFASIITAAQLGLEPGVQGQCYLIPYGDICQLVPGWKGLLDLANRSGRSSAWTGAVYPGDEFSFQYGTDPRILHVPKGEEFDEKKMLYSYSVGRVRAAEYPVIEVWRIAKIWNHRDQFNKVGGKHYSYRNPEMYARKVPLLQVLKYLPTSVELQTALGLEYSAQDGSQAINLTDAIEGTFSYAGDDSGGAVGSDAGSGADTGAAPNVPNADSAISMIGKAADLQILSATYGAIVETYVRANVSVPAAVESAYGSRKADLEKAGS